MSWVRTLLFGWSAFLGILLGLFAWELMGLDLTTSVLAGLAGSVAIFLFLLRAIRTL